MKNLYLKIALLTVLFSSSFSVFSQGFQKEWIELYGSKDSLSTMGEEIDPTGNVFVVGSALNTFGINDALYLKYDQSGTLLWSKKRNGTLSINDYGNNVSCDTLGNSYWLSTMNADGSNNYVLLSKYDSTGNLIWDYQSTIPNATAVDIDKDQNYNPIISFNASGTFGTTTVVKVDRNTGLQVWSQTINNSSMHTLSNGIFVEGGNVYGFGQVDGIDDYNFSYSLDLLIGSQNWTWLDSASTNHNGVFVAGGVLNNGELVFASNYGRYDSVLTGYISDIKLIHQDAMSGTVLKDTVLNPHNYSGESAVDLEVDGNYFYLATNQNKGGVNRIKTYKVDHFDSTHYAQTYPDENFSAIDLSVLNDNVCVLANGRDNSGGTYLVLHYDGNGAQLSVDSYNTYSYSYGSSIKHRFDGSVFVVGTGRNQWNVDQVLTLKLGRNELYIPPDYFGENVSTSFLMIENKGQVRDENGNAYNDVRFVSNGGYPNVIAFDNKLSFLELAIDTVDVTPDTSSRVDFRFKSDFAVNLKGVPMNSLKYRQNYYKDYAPMGIEGCSSFEGMNYPNIWNGISAYLYSGLEGSKVAFTIEAGANPNDIVLELHGQDNILVSSSGDLVVETGLDGWSFVEPIAYQVDANDNIINLNWTPSYSVIGNEVRFSNIGSYDPSKKLIILMSKGQGVPKSGIGNLEWSSYFNHPTTSSTWGWAGECVDVEGAGQLVYYLGQNQTGVIPTVLGTMTYTSLFTGGFDNFILALDVVSLEPIFSTYYGGSQNDFPSALSVKKNGGHEIIIAGETESGDLPTGTNYNAGIYPPGCYHDLWLNIYMDNEAYFAKFSSNGTLIWDTYWGQDGGVTEIPSDAEFTNQDNFYISVNNIPAGGPGGMTNFLVNELFHLSGMFAANQTGAGTSFIIKFDANCDIVFATDVGGPSRIKGLDADILGNVVFTGALQVTKLSSPPTPTNPGSAAMGELFEYNIDATFQTPSTFKIPDFSAIIGYIDLKDEVRWVMGYRPPTLPNPVPNNTDAYNIGHDIEIEKDGRIDVVLSVYGDDGLTRSKGFPNEYFQTQTAGGVDKEYRDLFLFELYYDTDAQVGDDVSVEWATYIGAEHSEMIYTQPLQSDNLTINRAGNVVYVCGNVWQNVPTSDPLAHPVPLPAAQPANYYAYIDYRSSQGALGGHDGTIMAISGQKELLWSTTFGGEAQDLILGSDLFNNSLYLAGFTETPFVLPPGSGSQYEFPNWRFDLNNPLEYHEGGGVSSAYGSRFDLSNLFNPGNPISVEETGNELLVYPNPTRDVIQVLSNQPVELIELYDYQGKLILTEKKKTMINVGHLADGIYLIKIRSGNQTHVSKVIKA
ncbi:MAG: T9SS type A sorting domain-containing protein [Flavobacteriales bacterium]|nr:T9SS type A sorting domain-containing protein [Flavobacteriales bacterium]